MCYVLYMYVANPDSILQDTQSLSYSWETRLMEFASHHESTKGWNWRLKPQLSGFKASAFSTPLLT